jgi:hypothetical protein
MYNARGQTSIFLQDQMIWKSPGISPISLGRQGRGNSGARNAKAQRAPLHHYHLSWIRTLHVVIPMLGLRCEMDVGSIRRRGNDGIS